MTSDSVRPATGSSLSGIGLDGAPITDVEVVEYVTAAGSLMMIRGPGQQLQRPNWAEELSALAGSRGLALSILETGRVVTILDIDRHGLVLPSRDDGDESRSRANHPSRGVRLRLLHDPD